MWVIIVVIIIILLLVIGTLGSNKRKDQTLKYYGIYNHRGFYDNQTIVENTLEAFNKSIDCNFGFELDVQLTKDNKIVVFHDFDLKRMCNIDKKITEMTYAELNQLSLLNTNQKIPLFEDVLKMNNGRSNIYVEIKNFSMHFQTLVDETVNLLNKYPGNYFIASFNVAAIIYTRFKHKEQIRCVIAQRMPGSGYFLEAMFLNFFAKPDIISYQYNKANWSLKLNKKLNRTLAGWPIGSQDELDKYKYFYNLYVIEHFMPKDS